MLWESLVNLAVRSPHGVIYRGHVFQRPLYPYMSFSLLFRGFALNPQEGQPLFGGIESPRGQCYVHEQVKGHTA
jgi:hypothetical protein